MRDQDWKIISKLYKERNITKTADLIFMTQPTLTKRIQQIEEELGVMLITRNSKGIAFTPEGEYVAGQAEKILSLLDETCMYIQAINGGKTGILKIGVPNSYCRLVMPRVIKQYTRHYDNVRFDISSALSHEVLKMVENHEVNVGFVRGDFKSDLERILVSVDQTHAVFKGAFQLDDLPELPQIDFTKEPTIIKATENWWRERFDRPPMVLMRVNHADTCRAMIMAGLGYGIFPDVGYFSKGDELTTIPLVYKDGSKLLRNTSLVYHREDVHNPLINNFIQFIADGGIEESRNSIDTE